MLLYALERSRRTLLLLSLSLELDVIWMVDSVVLTYGLEDQL